MAATEAVLIPKLAEYKFRVNVSDLPVAMVQSCDPGDRTNHTIKVYGAGMNHSHYEPGMVEFGLCILTNVVPIQGPGRSTWEDWANKAQNPATGRGDSDNPYKQISVLELDGQDNPVRTWDFFNCQVEVYKLGKREAGSQDKAVIEEVHLRYDSRRETVN
jgi:phage tail-like protein